MSKGKTAIVTGAASGIGAACAKMLEQQDCECLVLVDKDEEALEGLPVECKVIRYSGDISDPALWDRIESEVDGIDIAVLNAGTAGGGPIAEMEFSEWRRVLETNLDGAFLSLRGALRLARDNAAIVLTASVSGIKADEGTVAYGASKAGVIQITKVAAREGAMRGIRVNAIAPGGVNTPMWDQMPFFRELVADRGGDREAALSEMAAQITPLRRFGRPEHIAEQVSFLLSDAAATITGTVLVCDAGYSL